MLGLSIFRLNSFGIFKSSMMEIREIAIFFTTNFINWTKILEKICFCCQSYHSLDLSTPMHSVWFSHISLCYHTTRHFFPNIMQILYSSLSFNYSHNSISLNTWRTSIPNSGLKIMEWIHHLHSGKAISCKTLIFSRRVEALHLYYSHVNW